jgi:hypothetical protein
MMAIDVVLSTGSRHDQIRRKAEAVVYNFCIQGFRVAITDCGQKSIFSSHSMLSRAEIQWHRQLTGVITPKPLIG